MFVTSVKKTKTTTTEDFFKNPLTKMVQSTIFLFITEKMQPVYTNAVEKSPTSFGISDTGSGNSKAEKPH